jgi:hypothetical protein
MLILSQVVENHGFLFVFCTHLLRLMRNAFNFGGAFAIFAWRLAA